MEIIGPIRGLPFTEQQFMCDVQSYFGRSVQEIENSVKKPSNPKDRVKQGTQDGDDKAATLKHYGGELR